MSIFGLMIIFGLLNRCRGNHFYELTTSTTISRLASAGGMALVLALLGSAHFFTILGWAWLTLFFWMIFGWDTFWSAIIGHDPKHSKLWGIANMSWRMLLIAPCFIGISYILNVPNHAFYSLVALFFWLPYYIMGVLFPSHAIPYAEYLVGASIGILSYGVLYV